ncbi:MAG: hypothetical protein AVO34_08585 [Firmicutes bacterium ML8_F2]|nr:MAG: hypothetical protein AVO34_08585 [Firmicutes bacterium ML8_F2]
MALHLITLAENTVAMPRFLGNWGLSILVKIDDTTILYDTGFGYATVHNADLLGVDLSDVDKIVLSHGHLDHTGGLRDVLMRSGEKEIIAHPGIWDEKYLLLGKPIVSFFGNQDFPTEEEIDGVKVPFQITEEYNGIPFQRQELESLGARFKMITEPAEVAENVFTSGEIPLVTDYEGVGSIFYVKEGGEFRNDPLLDDLALFVKTDRGLVVLLGCGHRGMINTIEHARNITGEERVYAVVGGTHLVSASDERLDKTVRDLKELDVKRIGVSHCTGFKAAARLQHEFKDRFFMNNAGTITSIR